MKNQCYFNSIAFLTAVVYTLTTYSKAVLPQQAAYTQKLQPASVVDVAYCPTVLQMSSSTLARLLRTLVAFAERSR